MGQYPTGAILAENLPGIDTAELVQTGGQKAVYCAKGGGQTFALKVIALDSEDGEIESSDTDKPAEVSRAEREVAILKQVDVPVLARQGPTDLSVVKTGDAEHWLCFTEEWIAGEGLKPMIRAGRLPPCRVAQLAFDLIQAVCWLSNRGMVHRDVKPANIKWADDRARFVLLDTGIAFDLYGPSLTLAPVPVGTMAYLSPEQMDPTRKRALDFRSDLFAIGVVVYESAVGEHPFMSPSCTPPQVLEGILRKNPQTLEDRIDHFPRALSEFVVRLMGKSPHLRFRTCEMAQTAAAKIAVSLGVTV